MDNLRSIFFVIMPFLVSSCGGSGEKTLPTKENISESVYASGIIKAQNQYQAFANASGTIQEIFVKEGDSVEVGTPILAIFSETAKLNRENAELARAYADKAANQTRIRDLENLIEYNKNKWQNDSLLYERQKRLMDQGIGTPVELEQRYLAFENSRNAYLTSKLRYLDTKREIDFNEKSAVKNLSITKALEDELLLKSEVKGRLYDLLKERGEMVNPQTPLAVLGSADDFLLEMQVDEYDIVKIKKGQKIIVTMDSYRGETFEAVISKVNPIMNQDTKSFLVEGNFVNAPDILYPNLSLEANIVIQTKENVLVLPRSFILNDRFVINNEGDTIPIKLGLKDFQKAEIIEGIDENTTVIKPSK